MDVLQVFIKKTSIAELCRTMGHCIAILKQVDLDCVFKFVKLSPNEIKENSEIDKLWKRFKEGMIERSPKMFVESLKHKIYKYISEEVREKAI